MADCQDIAADGHRGQGAHEASWQQDGTVQNATAGLEQKQPDPSRRERREERKDKTRGKEKQEPKTRASWVASPRLHEEETRASTV
ncbi:hypothetical protein F503_01097 [Ophiostoma piceae UAMH 11346]|uniref:Uncharacterized protein n=1 Tax=Ophiostoma piceae (strain UAMH 11346) TaxID=1262450 RepID=S3C487_OPHP1|nr:hypothetical protein F503_01097 [Ophiostoma piceae UAMH 11346]